MTVIVSVLLSASANPGRGGQSGAGIGSGTGLGSGLGNGGDEELETLDGDGLVSGFDTGQLGASATSPEAVFVGVSPVLAKSSLCPAQLVSTMPRLKRLTNDNPRINSPH